MRALIIVFMLVVAGSAFAQDAPGTADHPAVTRFAGAEIVWQDEQAYEPYAVATGPVTRYRQIDGRVVPHVRTTRTYYELAGDCSHTEWP